MVCCDTQVIARESSFPLHSIHEAVQECGTFLQQNGTTSNELLPILFVVLLLRKQHACNKSLGEYQLKIRLEQQPEDCCCVNVEISGNNEDATQFQLKIPRHSTADVSHENDSTRAFPGQLQIEASTRTIMAELSKEEETVYE